MHRIDTATAEVGKFGSGKNGFTNGDSATGTPATQLDADVFDAYQEEICNVIEGAGIKLSKGNNNQLFTAIKNLMSQLALLQSNNLADLSDVAEAQKNLQLGALALKDSIGYADVGAMPVRGALGTGTNLNDLTGEKYYGFWWQGANNNASLAKNYPVAYAGSLLVIPNGATNATGCSQEYRPYTNNVVYRRWYNSVGGVWQWSAWTSDINSSGGGTINGPLTLNNGALGVMRNSAGITLQPVTDNEAYYYFGKKRDGKNHFYFGQGSANSDVITINNYLTGSSMSFVAGGVNITGKATPSDYSNFDTRYLLKTAAISSVRLSAVGTATNGNGGGSAWASAPSGAVVTAVAQESDYTGIHYRYVQYLINGTWHNTGIA